MLLGPPDPPLHGTPMVPVEMLENGPRFSVLVRPS